MNGSRPICRARQTDDVEVFPFSGEAKVRWRIGLHLLVGGKARLHLRRSLAGDGPRLGPINGLAIAIEPRAHIQQDGSHFIGNCPICARPDTQQQIAVLADDIH